MRYLRAHQDSPEYDVNPYNYKKVSTLSFMSFFLISMRLIQLDLFASIIVAKIVVSKFIEADAELMKINPVNGELVKCKAQSL